jgi:hypothetical protein
MTINSVKKYLEITSDPVGARVFVDIGTGSPAKLSNFLPISSSSSVLA